MLLVKVAEVWNEGSHGAVLEHFGRTASLATRRFPQKGRVRMGSPVFDRNSPAGKVLDQLRHGAMTVEELAKALRITDNAVRNQLRKLEALRLASRSGVRPGTSKPSILYAITPEGEIHFSTIYLPVLTQFLREAEGQCSGKQLGSFMAATGKSLATRYPRPTGGIENRVHAAARLLKSFGGLTDVRAMDGILVIRSKVCPLAALTSEHAAACKVLEALIREYVSAPVKTCCRREEDPQCCFEISR
jgi:predicted ArsR family transcriptional regulator